MNPLSNEKLRSYFLGKLSESEADNLEVECAASVELTSQAQMIERELADDYLRGTLTEADSNLFQTNYLISESRRKKVRAAQGLWKIANEPRIEKSLSTTPEANAGWKNFFSQRKYFQLAFTCLLLLFTIGAITLYWLNLSSFKNEVVEVKNANDSAPMIEKPTTPTETATIQIPEITPVNSVSPNKEVINKAIVKKLLPPQKTPTFTKSVTNPSTPEQKPVKSPNFATFLLSAGTLRDEGEQFIKINSGVDKVNLLLNPPKELNDYKIYRVVLKNADGETIFTSSNLKSLSFSIPAEKLENRTYMVYLEGQNAAKEFQSAAEYTFRVRR